MISAAADKKRSYSCCFFCAMLPLLFPIVFTLCFLWIIHNRNTAFIIYENLSVPTVFAGGKNESYCYMYCECYAEADMSTRAFDEYREKSSEPFLPIGADGIDVFCYRFNNIPPPQKKSYDQSNKTKKVNCYVHHVTTGFYSIIKSKDSEFQDIGRVYDSENQRIFMFRSYGVNEDFYRERPRGR